MDLPPLAVAESTESEAVPPLAEPARSADAAPPPSENGDEPAWPTADAETAELARTQERGEDPLVATALAVAEVEDEKSALPSLEALIQKIPAEVRDTLEDLFRAKFVRATRIRKKDLN